MLAAHGVVYLVIGGIGAIFLGSPVITRDIDICYERGEPNATALARALRELHARLRGADPNLPFILDGRTIAMGDSFTFLTDCGSVDVLATPAGTEGYGDLIRNAVKVDLGGLEVAVASIDDLLRMKRASNRPKDRALIPHLQALRDELDAV